VNDETENELPAFSRSAPLTLGIELELPLVGGQDFNLIGAAPDFGQAIHRLRAACAIGCACPDQALWLLHAFNRYIPA
jgi:gamma-glutamyl:cysteine ligase YbdK (ATP-grasp superfamily)